MRKNNSRKKVAIIIGRITLALCLSFGIYKFVQPKSDTEIIDKTDNDTNVDKVNSPYRMSGNSIEDFDLYFMQLENNKQNIIYSPLSIKYALEMLSEGANGNSKEQINALIGDYQAKSYPNNANMSFANALFIKDAYKDTIKPDYITTLKNKFNAEIMYDSFNTPNNLNAWVSKKTFGLIDDLFNDVSEYNFILTNALAIDMEWNYVIQAANNGKENYIYYDVSYLHEKYSDYVDIIMGDDYNSLKFQNMNAKSVQIAASINNYDIVNAIGEASIRKTVGEAYEKWVKEECDGIGVDTNLFLDDYIKELDSNYKRVDYSTDFSLYVDDNVKVFAKELKEYQGKTLEYIGIMPTKQDLDKYIKSVDAKSINDLINKLKTIELDNFSKGKVTKITGYIPLFKFDYELDLMNDLKELGITDVFDKNKADLSNISTNSNIFIGSASHKANIDFSNEGIKAAAATEFGGMGNDTDGFEYLYDVPVEIIDLTFDKPYMFLVRDKASGEVWFTGSVYEPTEYTKPVYSW